MGLVACAPTKLSSCHSGSEEDFSISAAAFFNTEIPWRTERRALGTRGALSRQPDDISDLSQNLISWILH